MKPAPNSSSNTDRRFGVALAVLSAITVLSVVLLTDGPDPSAAASGFAPASRDADPARATSAVDPSDSASGGSSRHREGGVAALLEGTWKARDGSLLYLGPLDPSTGVGACEASAARGRDRYRHTYRVARSDEAARRADIEIVFADPLELPSVQEFTLSPDGTSARRRLIGGGLALLQIIRLDPSASDTLTYVSPDPF